MARRVWIKVITLLLFFINCTSIFSEVITDKDFGFSLDIPEGFIIAEHTDDGMSYLFTHPNIPVNLALKITNTPEYDSSYTALLQSLKKLNAKYEIDEFYWNEIPCSISSFSMNIDQNYAGWSVATPTRINNCYLVLLCYSPAKKEHACEQFIMSTLNSLCIDESLYNTPGIIATYAYPTEGIKQINLSIGDKIINTKIDKSDCDASQFVVDLEYSVLTLYGKHKLWKEAWQRYYRMIYRDSFGRLQCVSENIFNGLYSDCKKRNPSNPDIEYAQRLLSWVQGFNYVRASDAKNADFTSLPNILCNAGSDCDSRSMLLCVLLKSINIETLFLFSPEYSHAMVATDIEAPGQKYSLDGNYKQYIMGETTANVTWGMIAQEHSDRKKWIPVLLP